MFWRKKVSYAGAHALVTGGSEGLGYAFAEEFLREGANVTIVARTVSKLESAVEKLRNAGKDADQYGQVAYQSGDVTDFRQITDAIKNAEGKWGPVDVLVVNAGTAHPGRLLDLDVEVYEAQMKLNYMGMIHSIKAAAPGMVERGTGHIVLISSALGVLGMSGFTAYAPTKWAMRGFADCLRMEFQGTGVDVSIAYPPDMDTASIEHEKSITPPETLEMMKAAGTVVFPPSKVAKLLIKGMKKGNYHLFGPDFLQSMSQSTMAGVTPAPYFLPFQAVVAGVTVFVSAIFWRMFDKIQRKYTKDWASQNGKKSK